MRSFSGSRDNFHWRARGSGVLSFAISTCVLLFAHEYFQLHTNFTHTFRDFLAISCVLWYIGRACSAHIIPRLYSHCGIRATVSFCGLSLLLALFIPIRMLWAFSACTDTHNVPFTIFVLAKRKFILRNSISACSTIGASLSAVSCACLWPKLNAASRSPHIPPVIVAFLCCGWFVYPPIPVECSIMEGRNQAERQSRRHIHSVYVSTDSISFYLIYHTTNAFIVPNTSLISCLWQSFSSSDSVPRKGLYE